MIHPLEPTELEELMLSLLADSWSCIIHTALLRCNMPCLAVVAFQLNLPATVGWLYDLGGSIPYRKVTSMTYLENRGPQGRGPGISAALVEPLFIAVTKH
jgi:hypothetical protein